MVKEFRPVQPPGSSRPDAAEMRRKQLARRMKRPSVAPPVVDPVETPADDETGGHSEP